MKRIPTFSSGLRLPSWLMALVASLLSTTQGTLSSSAQEAPVDHAVIRMTSPKSGTSFDAPGPIVFVGHAIDPAGDIRHIEFFANGLSIGKSDFWAKIATIPGMVIPHRLAWEGVAPGTYKVVARGQDTLGKPVESEAITVEVTRPVNGRFPLVPPGARWFFQNDGTDLGVKWRDPAFDSSSWPAGEAELGYGDGDESTLTRTEPAPHPLTAYFRHAFQVPADLNIARLDIGLVRDDGAVVYLNGKELLRDNLPDGEISFATPATQSTENENRMRRFLVKADALVAGENVLAVEVHQASPGSSDLSFDLQLTGLSSDTPGVTTPTVQLVGLNLATSEPRPEARIAPGRVALRRTGDLTRDLPVLLKIGGSATPGKDYPELDNPAVIPAGKSELELFVVALDDDQVEGTESVTIALGFDPLALPIYGIDPKNSEAVIEIHDADRPAHASLAITSPESGAFFREGAVIPVSVTAIDPEGYIARVELFDGNERVGVSEITFIVAPEPGTPIHHQFEWTGAAPGEHKLVARAQRGDDARWVSEPVRVLVGEPSGPVILEIVTDDDEARENGSGEGSNTARFIVKRVGGPKDVALSAFYQVEGTAANGIDYVRLTGEVPLRAGQDSAEIVVRALPDRLTEPTETVTLTLIIPPCIAIFPPPPSCYSVGARFTAKAVILDADGKGDENSAPTVTVASPEPGAVFSEGEAIDLAAVATDLDGSIVRLDLFVDDALIASAKEGSLKATWKDASVGTHAVTARAVDDDGAESTSRRIPIYVRAVRERAFVIRDLPPAYLPGAVLEVQLVVNPPRGAAAWLVEDAPPTGWSVSEISDGGVFDTSAGRVKFGPFTSNEERTLTYRVTVPSGTEGTQKFAGTSSLDGTTLPVAGETTVEAAGLHHPADAPSPDNRITGNEVTAYAAAWKLGKDWNGTGSIPLPYVTSAGFLWRSGEAYLLDAGRGAPPECWAPAGPRRTTPAGLAFRPPNDRESHRDLPATWRPGKDDAVQLVIQPPEGTLATAVEEVLPTGWRAVAISDAGAFDSTTRTIRWGLLEGDHARTLTYRAVPPSDAACTGTFDGRVSFDGSEMAIVGARDAGATDESTALRIVGSRKEKNGKPRLTVDAPAQQVYVIEASSDLRTWSEISAHLHTGDAVEVEVDDPKAGQEAGHRYYRLRPVGR